MKPLLVIITALYLTRISAQGANDNVLMNQNQGDFGIDVPDIILEDLNGRKVKLSSFKGKVIYLDFWSVSCAPCIKLFPAEESLKRRMKDIGKDSSVLFLKVCGNCPVEKWKGILNKYESTAINLRLPGKDFSLYRKYGVVSYPKYQIIGKNFTYISRNALRPDDIEIDSLLIKAADAQE